MKKVMIVGCVVASFLVACTGEKKLEQRFVYENEKIVDVETGDEYILDDLEEFTVIHTDGTIEKVAIDEAPFYSGTFSVDFLEELDRKMEDRKLQLIELKKNKLKEARTARYADLSDDELLAKFKKGHADELELGVQMDMIAELIERGVISEDEAPILLEIEPELINFDIELESPVM